MFVNPWGGRGFSVSNLWLGMFIHLQFGWFFPPHLKFWSIGIVFQCCEVSGFWNWSVDVLQRKEMQLRSDPSPDPAPKNKCCGSKSTCSNVLLEGTTTLRHAPTMAIGVPPDESVHNAARSAVRPPGRLEVWGEKQFHFRQRFSHAQERFLPRNKTPDLSSQRPVHLQADR